MDNQMIKSGITPKGYEKLTVSNVAVKLNIPEDSNYAIIVVEEASVRYRDDGIDPTSSNGIPLILNQNLIIASDPTLQNIKFIKSGVNNAKLSVNYYQI